MKIVKLQAPKWQVASTRASSMAASASSVATSAPSMATSTVSQSKENVEDLAINFRGDTYKHAMNNRKQYAIIEVSQPSQQEPYIVHLKKYYRERVKNSQSLDKVMLSSVLRTEASTPYLIIGIALYDPTRLTPWSVPIDKQDQKSRRIKPAAITAEMDNYVPFFVATPLTEAYYTTYFALLTSTSGPATPYLIHEDAVFLFKEFRSSQGDLKSRKKTTKKAVIDVIMHYRRTQELPPGRLRASVQTADQTTGKESTVNESMEVLEEAFGAMAVEDMTVKAMKVEAEPEYKKHYNDYMALKAEADNGSDSQHSGDEDAATKDNHTEANRNGGLFSRMGSWLGFV